MDRLSYLSGNVFPKVDKESLGMLLSMGAKTEDRTGVGLTVSALESTQTCSESYAAICYPCDLAKGS